MIESFLVTCRRACNVSGRAAGLIFLIVINPAQPRGVMQRKNHARKFKV
jgi:acetaldehyde dehydrogenase (acetylating)